MQIVVLSGKGGTGKTTIAVSLAHLIESSIKIDCDVDAANMHLFYSGEELERKEYSSGKVADIDINKCIECDKCESVCKFGAISNCTIDKMKCEGCGVCKLVCEYDAIKFEDEKTSDIVVINLENGKLVSSEMEIGADGSGLLVTELRKKAESLGDEIKIIDGSPGIGCSVMASITGTDICLAVTEPTVSGLNDLKRILELAKMFDVKTYVCINKFDINTEMSEKIEDYCKEENIEVIGKVHYDKTVLESVENLRPIVTYENSIAGNEIIKIAEHIKKQI